MSYTNNNYWGYIKIEIDMHSVVTADINYWINGQHILWNGCIVIPEAIFNKYRGYINIDRYVKYNHCRHLVPTKVEKTG